jgi:hypothetical protein
MNPILEIKNIIHRKGWIKHHRSDEAGHVCILGAIDYLPNPMMSLNSAIRMSINELYPDRVSSLSGGKISSFNDHPKTTIEDVDAVLQHAAEKWSVK